jgi:hypothetical protein
MKHMLWNNYVIANAEAFDEPLVIEYGEWPWSDKISQRFDKEGATKIAGALEAKIANGEPGIPVYQGHPDVPALAAQYPDKGAIGWIKKIDVENECARLTVEWDRFPGKGFGWMSPYWRGTAISNEDGKLVVPVDELISLGLVNNPRIKDFRLPNEEQTDENNQGENNMDKMKEICKLLGLPENADMDALWSALRECKQKSDSVEAIKAALKEMGVEIGKDMKIENELKTVIDKKVDEARKELENCKKDLESTKTELANSKAEVDKTKTELVNSQKELEKIKKLKTVSVTMALENQQRATESRMSLVNEIMAEKKLDFDSAWAEAKAKKPELFEK